MAVIAAMLLLLTAALTGSPANARPTDTERSATAGPRSSSQLQAQVLTWTAGDNFLSYLSAPTTATAGPATLVFENSRATGNTTGMQHTLTFETGDPRYNSDVDVNILADPTDSNGGRWTVDVVLSPGTYRYFCAIPGHGGMTGLLVVTGGGSDTTPPTVSATVTGEKDPSGAYVGSATVTLSATDSGSGVDRVEYSLDGGAYGTYSAPVTVNQLGQHTVSYRATDKAGNTSSPQSVSFRVVEPPPTDTTPPIVTAAVTGQRDGNGAYVGSATVTLSATDTESGVDRVEYSLDGGAYARYSAPVTVNQVGQHTVTYRATDKAGNTSSPQSVAFTVVETPPADTTPPTVTAAVTGEKDANGAYIGGATVTLSATDSQSGVDRVEFSLDGQPYAIYSAPVAVNQPGQHTVSYRATDKAGNTSTPQSVSFRVVETPPADTTPPTVTAAVTGQRDANGAYVGSATVTLSATDTESGVDRVEYSLDGGAYTAYSAPVTVNHPGQHTVTYRATDKAGNTSSPQSVAFTVVETPPADTTPPTVTAAVTGEKDPTGAYVGSATVTLSATDTQSGVDRVEFSLDGQPYAIYSAPVAVNQPGQHTVSYRATDKAGNTSSPQSVSFRVVETPPTDTTPPTVTAAVTGQRDANGAYVGSATVTLSATDTESGVDRVEYSLDGGAYARYSAPVTVNQVGQHTVSYRATDKAGNTSSPQSVAFTVVETPPADTTPPTVTAAVTGEKDANGAYIGGATVTLSATDTQSGVDRVEFSLDGQPYAIYSAPVAVNQPGQHTVSYRGTDKAGNTSTPQSVSFRVVEPTPTDTTPPTVTAAVTGQRDANGAYVGSATVTLSATDTQSGVDRVEYSLDGGAYTAYSAPVTVNRPGQHTVSYRATDKAGNTSSPQSVAFTVVETPPADTTPPTVTAAVTGQRDANGAYVGGATVTLTATDTQSGVDRVEFSLDGQPYAAYSAPVTVNQVGQHTVSYRATDKAGNTSSPQSVSFTVVDPPAPDTTPPTVTAAVSGQLDDNGAYVGSATVIISASDSGSGVDRVEYSLDGGAYARYSAPVTVNRPGQHTVSYRATDKAGNTSGTASVTFTVVASGPQPECVKDTRPTVWLGTVDSGVPNRVVAGDCTINNVIEDERSWPNHGQFVSYVNSVAEHLHHLGVISHQEHGKLASAAGRSGVGKPDTKNGYQPILDDNAGSFGKWQQVGAGGFTRNADGSITSKPVPGLGMLWYPVAQYGDFSLKFQWRDDAPGDGRANSGVFVRFPDVRRHPAESRPEWVAIKYGHELQILDRTDGDQYKSGSVYGFDRVDLAGAGVTPKGTWNDYEIRVVGQHYSVFRNGKLINEYVNRPDAVFSPPRADDPGGAGRQHATGYVGLQNHGTNDVISFRNVRIAPLSPCCPGGPAGGPNSCC
ncbi:OmpL47-type beta-barrel domain-containing protein [Micromonospora sp. NPDC006431]|uniref:OmpL47-type beta-barrel domain-containing protein n=1 Tax=Micromonospora sp. NPDC006431 TaxID=3364235 RepID=UPI0036922DEA